MNKIKSNPLSGIMQAFEKNKILKKILFFVIDIGLEDFVFRTINKKFLKKRKEFYLQRKKDVEKNINILEDVISRDVYINAIKYRCCRKRKDFPKYCFENQYFPADIIKPKENEVFVDCGVYVGDTIEKFLNVYKNKYKLIIGFEPDKENFEKAKQTLKNVENVKLYNYGVGIKSEKLKFNSGNKDSSKISEEGDTEIKVVNIDSLEECKEATFIKMDIEGFEPEALKGAEKIIKKNKPNLAICIYHSDDDMIDIIQYIHNLIPEYKIYIRHHSIYETETVMYAKI